MSHPIILPFLVLSVLIGAMYVTAIQFSLFYELPWFDVLLHLFGGMWVALAVFSFYRFGRGEQPPVGNTVYALLLAAGLAVGIAWEFLEIYMKVIFDTSQYISDTATDITLDVLGAFIVARVVIKKDAQSHDAL